MPSFESTEPSHADHQPAAPRSFRRGVLFLLIAAALVVIALAYWYDLSRLYSSVLAQVDRLGAWGPVLFILIYAVATVLLIPGSALTLGAGALFGVFWGTVYASTGATLGATCAFLIGRYLARDWVAARIARRPAFVAIDRAVAEEGWKIVGLTRLSPIFPFVLLNYAFGLTRVSLRDYVFASWLGMLPGSVMYVYVGSIARVGVSARGRTSTEWALYGVGLAATVGVTVLVTRTARRALARRAESSTES